MWSNTIFLLQLLIGNALLIKERRVRSLSIGGMLWKRDGKGYESARCKLAPTEGSTDLRLKSLSMTLSQMQFEWSFTPMDSTAKVRCGRK
jgi:hypothetical protein